MKRIKLFLIVVGMFMLLIGCGKQEIAEPVECTEFTLPDNYCPAMIIVVQWQ